MAYANPVLDVSDEALEEPPTDDNEQGKTFYVFSPDVTPNRTFFLLS